MKIEWRPKWVNILNLTYHIGFLLLGISAFYFYEERFFGDSGAYIFEVINNRSFSVANARFILAVSQWLAVLAVWLHLPLKIVLITYSIGHVVFFYILFLAGHFWLRQKYSGAVFLLLQTLGMNFTYFAWPYGEIPYGIGLVILMIMMLISLPRLNIKQSVLLFALIFLIVTSHPFVIILTGYGLAMLSINPAYRAKVIICGLMLLLMLALKIIVFPSYMGELVGQRVNEGITFGFDYAEFIGMLRMHSILFFCLVVLAVLQIIRGRLWWWVFTLPSIYLILFIIKQYFPLNTATQQYYISFSGIFILTLIIDYFDREPLFGWAHYNKVFMPLILLLITAWSYFPILNISREFSDRVAKIEGLIEHCRNMDGQRFIVNGYNYFKSEENIWMQSEISIESTLIACQQGRPVTLQLFERASEQIEFQESNTMENFSPSTPSNKTIRYPVSAEAQQTLAQKMPGNDYINNREYFPLDKDRYTFLNEFKTNTQKELKDCIEIKLLNIIDRGSNDYRLDIEIENNGESPIYSGSQNRLLGQLVLMSDSSYGGTVLYSFPLLTDLHHILRESVLVYNFPFEVSSKDLFAIQIERNGEIMALSNSINPDVR